jgi:hypothetical protein
MLLVTWCVVGDMMSMRSQVLDELGLEIGNSVPTLQGAPIRRDLLDAEVCGLFFFCGM